MQVVGRAVDDHRLLGVYLELVALGQRRRLARGLAHDRGHVDGLPGRLAAGVRAREKQEVGHQAPHPLRGPQRGARDLAVLALELGLEELEVREDARERRAQLVRGVGDELTLARERALGLGVGLGKLPEHLVERAREVGDLVVRAQPRQVHLRVARLGDAAGGGGQARDRLHRAPRHRQAGEQRERAAAEHAEGEEDAQPRDRAGQRVLRLRVLHVRDRRLAERPVELARGDAVLADVAQPAGRRAQVRRAGRLGDRVAVRVEDPDDDVVGRGELDAAPRGPRSGTRRRGSARSGRGRG